MALAKLGDGIISITGTFGGSVFKRDASGQHITAKQRHVKKERTPKQQAQNDWYCQLKREEYAGGPPKPADPEPEAPGTLLIYELDGISYTRQRSLTQPTLINVESNPEHVEMASVWVFDNWNLFSQVPGLTPLLVTEMLLKLFYQNMFTWGIVPAEALIDAKAELIAWAAREIALNSMAAYFAVWLGSAALIVCAFLHDFFSKHNVGHLFAKGESLARLNGVSYWARLVARPSEKMFDFAIGPDLMPPPFTQQYVPEREGPGGYAYDWAELYNVSVPRALWWDTFTWKSMSISNRMDAYAIGPNVYRAKMTPWDAYYYGVPVGWIYSGDPFWFINEIYDVVPI